MTRIGLIDPALYTHTGNTSPNIGDQVISRAVQRELRVIFGSATEFEAVPSHQYPSAGALDRLARTDHVFVGGSNLLYFRWWRPASWKIGPLGLARYRNLVLMGTGWGAYEIAPNGYGRWVCRTILAQDRWHSVRDAYTQRMASEGLAVPRVVNTACPTMWCLTDERLAKIPTSRGDECLFALTDYARDAQRDGELIRTLSAHYGGRLLFWPQGHGDLDHARSLGYTGRVLDRSFAALLSLLASGARVDYVGTRLHAGILCLEHGVRSLILSVDNRAREIAADTGLPVVERGNREALERWIEQPAPTRLRLPWQDIDRWRDQFRGPTTR
jgi:Polysaccharide pyruvyl transferase